MTSPTILIGYTGFMMFILHTATIIVLIGTGALIGELAGEALIGDFPWAGTIITGMTRMIITSIAQVTGTILLAIVTGEAITMGITTIITAHQVTYTPHRMDGEVVMGMCHPAVLGVVPPKYLIIIQDYRPITEEEDLQPITPTPEPIPQLRRKMSEDKVHGTDTSQTLETQAPPTMVAVQLVPSITNQEW